MGEKLNKRLAYALPAFALAVVGIPIYVYIPKFYTDVVGVHISILGGLILGVRLFDAVTDPVIGFLSDQTRTRFGRRRPYIALGSIALALTIYLLFNPPDRSPTFETWWFGILVFSMFLFWTLVEVPYEALGPEITFDYHERTALFGIRDGAMIAGTLMAASSPLLVATAFGLSADASGERAKFFLDLGHVLPHGHRFLSMVRSCHPGKTASGDRPASWSVAWDAGGRAKQTFSDITYFLYGGILR